MDQMSKPGRIGVHTAPSSSPILFNRSTVTVRRRLPAEAASSAFTAYQIRITVSRLFSFGNIVCRTAPAVPRAVGISTCPHCRPVYKTLLWHNIRSGGVRPRESMTPAHCRGENFAGGG